MRDKAPRAAKLRRRCVVAPSSAGGHLKFENGAINLPINRAIPFVETRYSSSLSPQSGRNLSLDNCARRQERRALGAGDGVKPQVERSGTRGTRSMMNLRARETGDGLVWETPPPLTGLSHSVLYFPGFRFAPPGALHHRPLCGLDALAICFFSKIFTDDR